MKSQKVPEHPIGHSTYYSSANSGVYSKVAILYAIHTRYRVMLRYWKLESVSPCSSCRRASGHIRLRRPSPFRQPGCLKSPGRITCISRICAATAERGTRHFARRHGRDAASTVIAEQRIDLAGRASPYSFPRNCGRSKLQPQRRYAIRATILGPEQRFLWTTLDVHLVDSSKPSVAAGTLTMSRVSGDAAAVADPGERLKSGEWTVVKLNGVDVPAGARGTLNFGASAVLTGRSFCNSFSGTYALAGQLCRCHQRQLL